MSSPADVLAMKIKKVATELFFCSALDSSDSVETQGKMMGVETQGKVMRVVMRVAGRVRVSGASTAGGD